MTFRHARLRGTTGAFLTLTLIAAAQARDFTCTPPAWQSTCTPGQGSISSALPPGQAGPVQASAQPATIPVQAPYPVADWWFSQIYKFSADPGSQTGGDVPQGNVINPLPFNIKPGFNGLAIYQPYPLSMASTVACGGGSIACPGFQAQQPLNFSPEVLPGLANAQFDGFHWPNAPLVEVQGFSTWSVTFDMFDAANARNEHTLRATAARGSPFVWIEYPQTTDASDYPTPQVQLTDASDQIFGTAVQPCQIWTNDSSFASAVSTHDGSNAGQPLSNLLVASVNGRTYVLVGPDGSSWSWKNFTPAPYIKPTFFNEGITGKRFTVVAALPANLDALIGAGQWTRADAVQFMVEHSYYRPANETSRTATRLSCAYTPGAGASNVTGTFAYESLVDIRTGAAASPTQDTLFALFPHQQAALTTPAVVDAVGKQAYYSSVKGYARNGIEPRGGFTALPPPSDGGQMRLGKGRAFTLGYTLPAVPPVVPPKATFTGDAAKLNLYLDNDFHKYSQPLQIDTYNWGKHMARAANNFAIATEWQHASAQCWKDNLCSALTGWFTANANGGELKAIPTAVEQGPGLFWYDAAWGTMIGFPAGFGSNTYLNDHHFHYGYFLRAAAVLGAADSAWRDAYRPFVELLARDLAADYNDQATVGGIETKFAAYNYFDPYAGHSNAAGAQQYANGVNQESSSEGVNAWYGMLLWANVVGDSGMSARAAFMYCSENDCARRYWFQEESQLAGTNPVQSGTMANLFDNVAQYAGFSPGAKYLHIINWLPFGGGAEYMSVNKPYAQLNYDRLVAEVGNTNWGQPYPDLIWMYRSISDAADANAQFAATIGATNGNEFDCDSGNTLAMTYLWINSPHGGFGGNRLIGDLNHDGVVNGADLGILLGNWGACPGKGACEPDINGDGTVDGADIGLLLGHWGP